MLTTSTTYCGYTYRYGRKELTSLPSTLAEVLFLTTCLHSFLRFPAPSMASRVIAFLFTLLLRLYPVAVCPNRFGLQATLFPTQVSFIFRTIFPEQTSLTLGRGQVPCFSKPIPGRTLFFFTFALVQPFPSTRKGTMESADFL